MKILYLTPQRDNKSYGEVADYLSDLTFHGLRTMYGADIIDRPKKDHMYKGYKNTYDLWGHGFTYAANLDDIEVDREYNGPFDFVFVSIHWTAQFNYNAMVELLQNIGYPPDRMAVLDGHDWPKYCADYLKYTKFFFKREIEEKPDGMYPIWFSLPSNKIVDKVPEKTRDFSLITPGSCEPHWPQDSRKTHTYTTEAEYYKDYQDSYFGLTCKKGGWDCMRHYEILANGCVPIFTDWEKCPRNTCYMLPPVMLGVAKNIPGTNLARKTEDKCYTGDLIEPGKSFIDHSIFSEKMYNNLANSLLNYTKTYLTTKYLAEYITRVVQL